MITRVGKDHKMVFVAYMMKGEANFWWEVNQNRAGVGVVPWDRFLAEVIDHPFFYPFHVFAPACIP